MTHFGELMRLYAYKTVEYSISNLAIIKKMQAEKQLPSDAGDLLDDINYLNQATKDEIQQINSQIRLRINEADLVGNVADSIIEEISSQLGRLTVKVKLTEKAIRSTIIRQDRKSKLDPKKSKLVNDGESLILGPELLVGNRNLLSIESSGDGISYVWSGSNPEIQFTFPLNRSKAIGMQIRLFALIKPEYSKQLKVLIDEIPVKHRFCLNEGLFVLSCNLPPSKETGQTTIAIILPATHSPMEVGSSEDKRKLGIAFHEICFGKPESRFAHLFKRLKLVS